MNGSGGSEQAGVCVVGGRFMFHFMTRRHERCQRRKPAFAHRTAGKDKLVIMQGSHRFFVDYRYDSCGLFAEGVIPKTAIGVPAAKERFVRLAAIGATRSERLRFPPFVLMLISRTHFSDLQTHPCDNSYRLPVSMSFLKPWRQMTVVPLNHAD